MGCVDMDGQTNSITLAFGTGPRGHSNVHAYSETGCPSNADLGEILPQGGANADTGSCVNINNYMIAEPNFYGYRINSVQFF